MTITLKESGGQLQINLKKQIQAGTELNAQLRVRVSLKPEVLRVLCNCLRTVPTNLKTFFPGV